MYRSALLVLLIPTLSVASDPMECVDPEFVRAFFSGTGSAPPTYSTEIPDHFDVPKLPSDMKPIGSRVEGNAMTVAFRSNQDLPDVFVRLAQALSEQGWKDVTYERSPSRPGFQLANRSRIAEYCREIDDANLAVVARKHSDQTLISIQQYERRTMHGCEGTIRASRLSLLDRLPVMDPPDDAKTANTRIGTDGHTVSTTVDLSAAKDREELLGYFEDQIRDQNWIFKTRWSSDISSGSVWTQNTSAQGLLIGTLHVYGSGTEPVRIRFSIDSADPTKAVDHGMSLQCSSRFN